MKTNLIIALAAMIALLAGVYLQQKTQPPQAVESASVRLDFSYPDVDGQMQAVSQWQGKILVINFWATWCPPCLEEIPEFIQLQQAYQAHNVQFVGIALDDQKAVADYLQRININYPMLIAGDEGEQLARQLGNMIQAVPFSVIVNQQGQIVHRQSGELSKQQFLKVVQPLMAANSGLGDK